MTARTSRIRDGFSVALLLAAWIPWWIAASGGTLLLIAPLCVAPILFFRRFRSTPGLILAGVVGTSWAAVVTTGAALRVRGWTSAAATAMRTVDTILFVSVTVGLAMLVGRSVEALVIRRPRPDEVVGAPSDRPFPRRWWAYLAVGVWVVELLLVGPLLFTGFYKIW